jgi:hypothetical protein
MGHICVVMKATHDMRPAGRMFDMPDIEYVFFIQISKCKNILNKKSIGPFFCERRTFIQFKL